MIEKKLDGNKREKEKHNVKNRTFESVNNCLFFSPTMRTGIHIVCNKRFYCKNYHEVLCMIKDPAIPVMPKEETIDASSHTP